MGVAADDDDFQLGEFFLGPLDQLQAVTARHTDVGDQNIRVEALHQLQGLQAVGGHPGHLHPQAVPVGQHQDQLAYPVLVVRHHHSQHGRASSLV